MNLDTARDLVALEDEARRAVEALRLVSRKLNCHGKDVKLSGFSWSRPGHGAEISVQGTLAGAVCDLSERGS